MSTNHTENYNLSQWEATDQILREDFNADNAKIDEVLQKHSDLISQKGNCNTTRLYYQGDGKCGASAPCRTGAKEIPSLVFIIDHETGKFLIYIIGGETSLSPWYPNSPVKFNIHIHVNEDLTYRYDIDWYSDTPEHQFNVKGRSYGVVVLYPVK